MTTGYLVLDVLILSLSLVGFERVTLDLWWWWLYRLRKQEAAGHCHPDAGAEVLGLGRQNASADEKGKACE